MIKEHYTTVTSKGQITLPADIRRLLGIEEGDKMEVSLIEGKEAQVVLKPIKSIAELTFGSVAPRKQPEDFQALRRAFEEAVVAEVMAEERTTERP